MIRGTGTDFQTGMFLICSYYLSVVCWGLTWKPGRFTIIPYFGSPWTHILTFKLFEHVKFCLTFKDLSSFILVFSTPCSVLMTSRRPNIKLNIGLLLSGSLFTWIWLPKSRLPWEFWIQIFASKPNVAMISLRAVAFYLVSMHHVGNWQIYQIKKKQ